jgi:hypothetical protein
MKSVPLRFRVFPSLAGFCQTFSFIPNYFSKEKRKKRKEKAVSRKGIDGKARLFGKIRSAG